MSEADYRREMDKFYDPESRAMEYVRRVADMDFEAGSLAAKGQQYWPRGMARRRETIVKRRSPFACYRRNGKPSKRAKQRPILARSMTPASMN